MNYKINQSIEIVDTSIQHHLEKIKGKDSYSFIRDNSSKTHLLRDYSIYSERDKFGTGFDELLRTNLRKLSDTNTELSITDPASDNNNAVLSILNEYLPDHVKIIEERARIINKIIKHILDGLKSDGMRILGEDEREFFTLDEQKIKLYREFVDRERLQDLRTIQSENFDLSKLIKLCEEVNDCFEHKSFFSVAMLLRTIMDHIPPIFSLSTFEQVTGQYGNKSFKEHMTHLDKSLRKIADSYLHLPIRKSEVLPNQNQVNFSADLDVLLAEIIRILK